MFCLFLVLLTLKNSKKFKKIRIIYNFDCSFFIHFTIFVYLKGWVWILFKFYTKINYNVCGGHAKYLKFYYICLSPWSVTLPTLLTWYNIWSGECTNCVSLINLMACPKMRGLVFPPEIVYLSKLWNSSKYWGFSKRFKSCIEV